FDNKISDPAHPSSRYGLVYTRRGLASGAPMYPIEPLAVQPMELTPSAYEPFISAAPEPPALGLPTDFLPDPGP
ncbi:hypothetical protein Dimus_010659, partial [Dionaea muscipula]